MNNWNFTGNVGKSEMRYLPNGDGILQFSVAVSSGYGDKKQTTWANCALFGKRGEAVSEYVQKGSQVGVTGEVTLRPWTDKEGRERHTLEVRVNDLTLLGSRLSQESASSVPQPRTNEQTGSGFDDFEEVPF
jgi:single-strand DNA-binding protein